MGAKVIRHTGSISFQIAEVAVSRELFHAVLQKVIWSRILPVTRKVLANKLG